MVIFCLQIWKGSDVSKSKRLAHEERMKELIKSMIINDRSESDELNKKAEEVDKPQDAVAVIKQ